MTLATLISRLRILAKDAPASNPIFAETAMGTADGTNKNFRLQYTNIVGTTSTSHSVYLTYGSNYRVQNGFTMDLANGIITFAVAPSANAVINADYSFNWFSDADHTEFLNDAAQHLGQTDPTLTDAGLIMALLQYALGYYWQARATQYAHRYSSSAMGVSATVDVVTKNYTALAELAFKLGDNFREMFYKRQGAREAPSSGTGVYAFDPYAPRR